MRLATDRQTGKVQPRTGIRYGRDGQPLFDRRGRHTKADRLRAIKDLEEAMERVLFAPRPCECDVRDNRTAYHDGDIVCTGCGLVLDDRICAPNIDMHRADSGNGIMVHSALAADPRTWNSAVLFAGASGYPGYKPWNHFAELLKQATNMDPRIPSDILRRLADAWPPPCLVSEHDRDIVHADGRAIKALIRSVDPALVRKYAERWLQIKIHICGHEHYRLHGLPLIPDHICHAIHERYIYFSKCFRKLRKNKHPLFQGRNNVPQLNAVTLQLLAQEDVSYVAEYGWYFTMLATPASRLITEYRIRTIIAHIEPFKLTNELQWTYYHIISDEDRDLFTRKPHLPLLYLRRAIKPCLSHSPHTPTSVQ